MYNYSVKHAYNEHDFNKFMFTAKLILFPFNYKA